MTHERNSTLYALRDMLMETHLPQPMSEEKHKPLRDMYASRTLAAIAEGEVQRMADTSEKSDGNSAIETPSMHVIGATAELFMKEMEQHEDDPSFRPDLIAPTLDVATVATELHVSEQVVEKLDQLPGFEVFTPPVDPLFAGEEEPQKVIAFQLAQPVYEAVKEKRKRLRSKQTSLRGGPKPSLISPQSAFAGD